MVQVTFSPTVDGHPSFTADASVSTACQSRLFSDHVNNGMGVPDCSEYSTAQLPYIALCFISLVPDIASVPLNVQYTLTGCVLGVDTGGMCK